MTIPKKAAWLLTLGTLPKMVEEGLKLLGLQEIVGKANNPFILEMCKVVGCSWIKDDETPWCGTAHGYIAIKAGKTIPFPSSEIPRAASWAKFGTPVTLDTAVLGDTIVKERVGGHHVALLIGRDKKRKKVYVMGGNQSNAYGFAWINEKDILAVRRPPINTTLPESAKAYNLSFDGSLIGSEA